MTRFPHTAVVVLLAFVLVWVSTGWAQQDGTAYRPPEKIDKDLAQLVNQHKDIASLHELARTPGDRPVDMVEIGGKDGSPAILVVASMEGNSPPAGEAALHLAELLVTDWADLAESYRWFIVPCGNPDGYARYFDRPLSNSQLNDRPYNSDKDDATDEDGPDDLNGDGYITVMRQERPDGEWIEVADNPLLLRKADGAKGEVGKYRLLEEGIDNDGDGEVNEDGPGGVNPGHNFPHNFQHFTKTDGPWAASENESRALLRFAFDHPEVAMVLTLGRTNSLKEVPQGGRKAEATADKYKLPERWARRTGLDPDTEYPLKDLLELARDITGYKELTADMLLQWLDAGAAVNPDRKDTPYWSEISDRYNEFLKEQELDGKRLAPPGFSDGCVEEWAYYQYGVPSFSMDFWTLPEPKKEEAKGNDSTLSLDDLEKMSSDEVIGLGEEKIAAFLKAHEVPEQFTAARVIEGLKAGQMTPKRMAKMLRRSEKDKDEGGADEKDEALYAFDSTAFLAWQPYDHPTLGRVEIGGMKPWSDLAPPPSVAAELIDKQLPFVRDLVGMLPKVNVAKVLTERRSPGVWKVEAWIANDGLLPYPTHQGQRCQRPSPVVATLSGRPIDFLEGRPREVLGLLEGSGGAEKVSWLIKAADGGTVTIEVNGYSAGSVKKQVSLTEVGR